MCELLIYARVDGPDDELHPMRYRPGDVVDVKPDGAVIGAGYGTDELKPGSSFRVVAFPGLDIDEDHPLLASRRAAPATAGRLPASVRRRDFRFDLAHPALPSGFSEWWARDDGTKFEMHSHEVTDFMTAHPAHGLAR